MAISYAFKCDRCSTTFDGKVGVKAEDVWKEAVTQGWKDRVYINSEGYKCRSRYCADCRPAKNRGTVQ